MLPVQKTKKQIEQEKQQVMKQRQEASNLTNDMLKIQTVQAPSKGVNSARKSAAPKTTEQKSMAEVKTTVITISGVGGDAIRPGSGKLSRQGSAKPIMPQSAYRQQNELAKNVHPPTKKPAQILEHIGNQPKQQQLMQEYANLYSQTMNKLVQKPQQQKVAESYEVSCVKEAIKNFHQKQDSQSGKSDAGCGGEEKPAQQKPQQQAYENEDIFANDPENDDNKHEMACGDDVAQTLQAVPQSNNGTQADNSQNTYMEQIQTNLILNQLVQQTSAQQTNSLERRRQLIQQILQEEGDDDMDVEDIMKEIDLIEDQKQSTRENDAVEK